MASIIEEKSLTGNNYAYWK